MVDREPLEGILAHRLLNEVTAIHGLVATAGQVLPGGPDHDRVRDLLDAAAARSERLATQLTHLAQGRIDLTDPAPLPLARPSHEPS